MTGSNMAMKYGDKGSSIEELQERINGMIEYENLTIGQIKTSGEFDIATKEALQAIQKHYGLKDDGIADKDTLALIVDKVTISKELENTIKAKYGFDKAVFEVAS